MDLTLLVDHRKGNRLEIVVPVFNEGKRIGSFIRHYRNHADVVLLDDSSTDDTTSIADSLGATVYRRWKTVQQCEEQFVYYFAVQPDGPGVLPRTEMVPR